jgi:hypothetical protein
MSEQNLESSFPKGPAVHVDSDARPAGGHDGVQLDKTLRHVRLPGDLGPDKTPGGHGQVWRRRDEPGL